MKVPLLNDLSQLLRKDTLSNGDSQNHLHSFEASIYTSILLRLRLRHDIQQLLPLRSALKSQRERLDMISGDPEAIQGLANAVEGAYDIITIGTLSLAIEANIQRLLCETLGTALVSVITHLHVAQGLQCQGLQSQGLRRQAAGISSTIERICVKFAHLLFWDGKPKTVHACTHSLQNWVIDSKSRSSQQGRSNFLEERFQDRNKTSLLVSFVETLFNRTAPSALEKGPTPNLPMNSSTLSKLVEDIRDFQDVSFLLMAIRDGTGFDDVGCAENNLRASELAALFPDSHGDSQFLIRIAKTVEKLQSGLI
jgi:hypothetical protein